MHKLSGRTGRKELCAYYARDVYHRNYNLSERMTGVPGCCIYLLQLATAESVAYRQTRTTQKVLNPTLTT